MADYSITFARSARKAGEARGWRWWWNKGTGMLRREADGRLIKTSFSAETSQKTSRRDVVINSPPIDRWVGRAQDKSPVPAGTADVSRLHSLSMFRSNRKSQTPFRSQFLISQSAIPSALPTN